MNTPLKFKSVLKVVEGEWGRFTAYSTAGDSMLTDVAPVQPSNLSIISVRRIRSMGKSISALAVSAEGARLASGDEKELAFDFLRLPEFLAALFATVLEDAVVELRVLVSCNMALHVSKTLADMELLVARKFGARPLHDIDDLALVDPSQLHCERYKIDKLDADRKFLGKVLEDAYKDTCEKSYRSLVDHNENMTSFNYHRAYLLESDEKNRVSRRELAKRLRQQRNHIKSVIYDADVAIDGLKTKIEDVAVIAAVRRRYSCGWQGARTERHKYVLAAAEGALTAAVGRHKLDADHEQRVHSEVELLTNIAIDETLREVEVWMEKYDRDIEAIDLQIQKKKADYYITLDKKLKLEETLAQHALLIQAWISFKEARESARVYAHTMTEAALVVQAWWRGIIVRRELGPFRPKPKEKDNA